MGDISYQQTSPYPTGMVITSTGEKWVLIAHLSQGNRADLYRWSDIGAQFEKIIEIPEGIILNDISLDHNDHIILAGVNNNNNSSVPIVLRLDPTTILIEEIVFNGFPEKSMIVKIKGTESAFIASGQEIINNDYFWRTWQLPLDGGQIQLLDSFTLDSANRNSSPTSLSVDSKGIIWVGGWAKDTTNIQHAILRKTTNNGNETVIDLSESNSNSGVYVRDLHIDKEEDVLLSISANQAPYWRLGHFSVDQDSLDIFDSTSLPKAPDGIFQHPTGILFVIGNDNNGFPFIKAGTEDSLETTWADNLVGLAQDGDFSVDIDGAVWAYTSSWNITGNPSIAGKILRYQCP